MNDAAPSKKEKGSKVARASAARLASVQAVYQILTNDQTAASVISEYRLHRFGEVLDGEEMVTPDGVLFHDVVNGVYARLNEVEDMVKAAMPGKSLEKEPLLMAVMLCGAWELLSRLDVDTPVIVSDYLNVTHAFYDQGENKLVNAVLDKISTSVR